MTKATDKALSADTPESVAARLAAKMAPPAVNRGMGLWTMVNTDDLAALTDATLAQEAEIARLTGELQVKGAALYDATDGISGALRADALEAAEARATQAEAALAASEKREKAMREALEKAQPIADAFRASGVDLLSSDYDICRLVCPHITVAQMQAFCAALTQPATQPRARDTQARAALSTDATQEVAS